MAIGESASHVRAVGPVLSGKRIVIALDGAVDLESASRLDRLFVVAVDERVREVTLDMSALQLIDAAAISSVLRGMATLRAIGTDLDVRYPSPMAQQLFEMSHVGQVVGIEFGPDCEDFLRSRSVVTSASEGGGYSPAGPEAAA